MSIETQTPVQPGLRNTWQRLRSAWLPVWVVLRREIRDTLRDWRIVVPIVILVVGFPFLAPKVLTDCVQVTVESVCMLLPNAPNLVHNRIVSHGYGSSNSSGVQMTGGSYPASRHTRSIVKRTAAFAM